MNKLIITLLFLWIGWKVLQSIFEELQTRMEDRGSDKPEGEDFELESPPARRQAPTVSRPRQTRRAEVDRESGLPPSGQKESDLERWYREAQARRRQLGGMGEKEQHPRETVRREPGRQRAPSPPPQPVLRRAEPRARTQWEREVERVTVRRPRESRVEAERVRRERAVPPPVPSRKSRKARKRAAAKTSETLWLRSIGRLDKQGIRRGIIMAEILGPPKALRDIDSRLV